MREPTEEELAKSAKIIGGIAIAVGIVFAVLSNRLIGPWNLILGLSGIGFILLGGVVAIKGVDFGQEYVEKQARERGEMVEDVVDQTIIEDRQGIVWVWVVAIATWAIMAVAYFSLSTVVYMVLDNVESFYSFDADALQVLQLTRNVMAWFLIIMTIGIIGWALINSARRETQTYPL